MAKRDIDAISKRERQIMDAIYRLGDASVTQVIEAIPDPPSYSAVRATLNILVQKEYLSTRKQGRRLLYRPVRSRKNVAKSSLRKLVDNFFEGSVSQAVAGMIDAEGKRLTSQEIDELQSLIENYKKERGNG